MMIKEFEILDQDFLADIKALVWDEFFQHYYLINTIDQAINGDIDFYDAFTIIDSNSWIIGLWVDGNYMLYGKNWTENQIQILLNRIDFTIYQNDFHFLGTKDLIEKIQTASGLGLDTFKQRLFYKCDKVNEHEKNPLFVIEKAIVADLDELTQMVCDYFEDEYHGINNKDFEIMKVDVSNQILLGKLWILKYEGVLKSMCSIIPTYINTPIIGSFFTKRESRNLGYGKSLLFEVTNELLKHYAECWLIADETNTESNIIFTKVGYVSIYNTLDLIVKSQ